MLNYSSTIRVAAFMSIITIISKFLGLFREIILASIYSTGPELTAFLAGSKVPLMLFDMTLGGVISTAFIPIFNEIIVNKNKEKAFKFANEYVNLIIIITLILTVGGVLFSKPLMNFTLSGDDITPQTLNLAIDLSRIMFGMIVFTGVAYCFVGILNCNGQFYITSVLSLVSNGVIIIYLFAGGEFPNVYGLAFMMVIAWALQVAVQVPSVSKFGYKYKPTLKVITPETKDAITLAIPILISSWASPLASLINMKMASYIYEGRAVVAMELANRLYVVISGIFAYVISNLSYPYLSKVANEEDQTSIRNLLRILLKSITFIITPIMVGLVLLGIPIVRVAYERGNFTLEDAQMTGVALMSLGVGMLAFSFNEILNKSFYAIKQPKVPMINATVGIVISIILSVILPIKFEIAGLGLALAIGTIITCFLNLVSMAQKIPNFLSKEEIQEFIKIGISVGAMGIVVIFIKAQLTNVWLQVIISTVVGAIIYLFFCLALKVSIFIEFTEFIKTQIKLRKN